jgi:transglutaminase-like putative cysteine protease
VLIRLGYELAFELPSAAPMVVMLYTHPSAAARLQYPAVLIVDPAIPVEDYFDGFGIRCARLLAPPGPLRLWGQNVRQCSDEGDEVHEDAAQADVTDLPTDILSYLLSSRYCEVDLLANEAWELFGNTPPGWGRVQAICDWVHAHVEFGYAHACPTKTAVEVYRERVGVCRDFQHLAVTFCRCLNIPARYATGYLGDIRSPVLPGPMDFSAWFQAYLSGRWYTFDARFNTPRVGRTLMAVGRDAVDVALTTSFGPADLKTMLVVTDEI